MLLVALKLQLRVVKSMDQGSVAFNLKLNKKKIKKAASCKLQAASFKHQASSLTVTVGHSRITKKVENNETNNNI